MRHLRSFLVLVGIALLSAYFMASAHRRASNDAIQQLYAQERILAEQAAKGISEYFSYYRQTLEFLGRNADVVGNTARGQALLREFCVSQRAKLLSITRVGLDGRMAYTYPDEKAIGRHILDQPHVQAVFDTRRPVVSRVFTSVQGFEAVALHVPVFGGDRFAGSLAVLVPFEAISKTHVEGVRIGESGYAILLSREGIELFCPVPGHTGRSIYETSKAFPATLAMADRMLRGETGTAIYDYDHFEGEGTSRARAGTVRKHAFFTRIPLEDTFWSIIVTAPEAEALVFVQGFRNRWVLAMGLLLLAFGAWGATLARAYLTLDREETLKVAQQRVREAERERERALRESEERLRQAQKLEAVGQLAGGVAHDYNNLLTVQLGHLDMLKEMAGLPAGAQESLGQIEKSARMAARLTAQLLAFSRRQVLQMRRLDLNEVVESLSRLLRRVLREDITLDLRPGAAPHWVDADAGTMEQVVMNLVVNARDAMPDGGVLAIAVEAVSFTAATASRHAASRAGDFVCLSVSDTGKGMDAETRDRIFEPFFTTKEAGKGTGLGLATVYGIVEQHQGWIEVDSTPGSGSVFRVYLAAREAPASAPDAAGRASETDVPRGRGELILVAEDDPAVRRMVTTSLERLGYAVVAAADAQEAGQLWRLHAADVRLLLTDMVMVGGASGLELAGELRRDRPALPVLVMSGYSQDLVSGGLGADMAFLAKPWTQEALARAVRRCLDE
jgi:signal transduction histidine kinase/CheY-like chemotaxis protein